MFRTTPIEVVCIILKMAAIENKDTALVLLSMSKAIHNLLIPIIYDAVHLPSDESAAIKFAMLLRGVSVPGCSRPSVRYLNTSKISLRRSMLNMAVGRPEIEHVCVSMNQLSLLSSKALHPSHVGIVLHGTLGFPQNLKQLRLFMRASHVYIVDGMLPTGTWESVRPHLQSVTHVSFVFRPGFHVRLRAPMRAVLELRTVTLVLVICKYDPDETCAERGGWLMYLQRQLRKIVPESDSRVVILDDLELEGLTWEEDEESIWRLAEEKRLGHEV